jgi:hypothetical protein
MTAFTIMCASGSWLVYAGAERRWPVNSGFATRESAEQWAIAVFGEITI